MQLKIPAKMLIRQSDRRITKEDGLEKISPFLRIQQIQNIYYSFEISMQDIFINVSLLPYLV